jgi:acyl carrier protein
MISAANIEAFLQERIAQDLEMNVQDVSLTDDLSDIGLSSVLIAYLEGDLEEWLAIEIPAAFLVQHPVIREAARLLHAMIPAEPAGTVTRSA